MTRVFDTDYCIVILDSGEVFFASQAAAKRDEWRPIELPVSRFGPFLASEKRPCDNVSEVEYWTGSGWDPCDSREIEPSDIWRYKAETPLDLLERRQALLETT